MTIFQISDILTENQKNGGKMEVVIILVVAWWAYNQFVG